MSLSLTNTVMGGNSTIYLKDNLGNLKIMLYTKRFVNLTLESVDPYRHWKSGRFNTGELAVYRLACIPERTLNVFWNCTATHTCRNQRACAHTPIQPWTNQYLSLPDSSVVDTENNNKQLRFQDISTVTVFVYGDTPQWGEMNETMEFFFPPGWQWLLSSWVTVASSDRRSWSDLFSKTRNISVREEFYYYLKKIKTSSWFPKPRFSLVLDWEACSIEILNWKCFLVQD